MGTTTCAKSAAPLALTGALGWLAAALVFATLATSMAVAQSGQRQPPAKQGQQQQQQRPQRNIDFEAVMYAQPRIIDEVMASVLPSGQSEASTYFVGFAGWAEQDVFIREVAQARDVVEERFGAHGRSVLLVNHVTALQEVPLATVTNLDIVLRRVGGLMSPKKDTLILFLTSHGIQNLFAVEFPGLPLNHLTPRRLADILDRSGIENRIIIISACHSGSFIPALSSPKNLVLTAARADRTSFGCDHENDWTFFGNALFNHALRKTTSLPEAFAQARVLIGEWEARDKLTPSEPQIFQGEAIGPVIERLARLPAQAPVASGR